MKVFELFRLRHVSRSLLLARLVLLSSPLALHFFASPCDCRPLLPCSFIRCSSSCQHCKVPEPSFEGRRRVKINVLVMVAFLLYQICALFLSLHLPAALLMPPRLSYSSSHLTRFSSAFTSGKRTFVPISTNDAVCSLAWRSLVFRSTTTRQSCIVDNNRATNCPNCENTCRQKFGQAIGYVTAPSGISSIHVSIRGSMAERLRVSYSLSPADIDHTDNHTAPHSS